MRAAPIRGGCWLLGNAVVRDSVCWSTGGGVGLEVQAGGPAVHNTAARNVTAVAAGLGGVGVRVDSSFGSSMYLNALNTIASGPAGDAAANTDSAVGGSATLTLVNSDYATEVETGANATVTDPGSANNLIATPLFADVDSGDFHERRGSPTINHGSRAGSLGQFDIDGEAREQGGAPDIGADEFDQVPPATRIKRGPGARTASRSATFRFSSSEPGSTFKCKLDGEKFTACSSPKTYKKLKPGAHRFQVRARDQAGNVDATPAGRRWRVLSPHRT